MNAFQEQFSAVRANHLEQGLHLMHGLGEQVLNQTDRLCTLQFQAARTALEQSSAAMRQLFSVRSSADLLATGAQSQQQMQALFDFGRAFLSIATSGGGLPLRSYSADALSAITTANAAAAQQTVAATVASLTPALVETAPAALVETAPAAPAAPALALVESAPPVAPEAAALPEATLPVTASSAAVDTSAAPALVTNSAPAAPQPDPIAAPTPIAQAASEVADMPLTPAHPVAASMPVDVAVEIEVQKVAPVDAVAPVAAPATTTKVTELRGTKGRRKQN